jgi:GT2 family glycosyltransferase
LKIAIVILNWNGRQHLEKYLPSVTEYSDCSFAQVIVADNGSTDDSIDFITKNYPTVELVRMDHNYGFAGGYNRALEEITADIFCLLNSDVRVSEGWLNPIVSLFETDNSIAAIQPKILSDREPFRYEHAGAAGGFIDKYGYPFCRGRIMNKIEDDHGQYDKCSDIFWASGACLFIRADIFRRAGGFDADYFAHMEEIDLCWRLKNQGYRIVYTPESIVYHWGGATLEYNNPRKIFLNFRNSLWTLYKNYTGTHLFWILLRRMIIDTFAIVKYFLTFDWKNSFAIVKAHIAFHSSKKVISLKRNKMMKEVKIFVHPEILNRSIVWQFFIYSRKRFSDFRKFC